MTDAELVAAHAKAKAHVASAEERLANNDGVMAAGHALTALAVMALAAIDEELDDATS